jgi:hypothetical protein
MYYAFMTAMRDDEIQKKGVVCIFDAIGQERFHSDRQSKLASFFWFLPVRLVALHLCYDNNVLDLAVK